MKWEYKNIFYPLKKEGLLGDQILDEVELEQTFNEYGFLGWELISVMNMQNGVVAIFKRVIKEIEVLPEIREQSDKTAVQEIVEDVGKDKDTLVIGENDTEATKVGVELKPADSENKDDNQTLTTNKADADGNERSLQEIDVGQIRIV
ncbi:MAG: DUF4177 domain-containing protein [Desulfotalea sp.]